MDAPPSQEDCLPFVRIAGYLEAMRLNAPRIIEADLERGFLLLTDLGTTQFLQALQGDATSAEQLYDDAISSLSAMQSRGAAYQSMLPPYDESLLEFELSLFYDWLCIAHLGIEWSDDDKLLWRDSCSLLIGKAICHRRTTRCQGVQRTASHKTTIVRTRANAHRIGAAWIGRQHPAIASC